jgi:hypothetical protein
MLADGLSNVWLKWKTFEFFKLIKKHNLKLESKRERERKAVTLNRKALGRMTFISKTFGRMTYTDES